MRNERSEPRLIRRAGASSPLATYRLGDIAPLVAHGLINVGEEPVKVVGFFCEPEMISTFEEPVQPIGQAQRNQGAPAPA